MRDDVRSMQENTEELCWSRVNSKCLAAVTAAVEIWIQFSWSARSLQKQSAARMDSSSSSAESCCRWKAFFSRGWYTDEDLDVIRVWHSFITLTYYLSRFYSIFPACFIYKHAFCMRTHTHTNTHTCTYICISLRLYSIIHWYIERSGTQFPFCFFREQHSYLTCDTCFSGNIKNVENGSVWQYSWWRDI